MRAARTLKKNTTEIACPTSSSLALITGAVAAIAEPPQIDEPTPISVQSLVGMFMYLHTINEMIRDVDIVATMIGRDS